MSCSQQLDALKANNWMNNSVQWNQERLQSQVLMAHNILNSTMSPWAWCSSLHQCSTDNRAGNYIVGSIYAKMPSVKCYTKFLASDMHSSWGYASQTTCKANSRVGAHSSKLWPYTGKVGGWALLQDYGMYWVTQQVKNSKWGGLGSVDHPSMICSQWGSPLCTKFMWLTCNTTWRVQVLKVVQVASFSLLCILIAEACCPILLLSVPL